MKEKLHFGDVLTPNNHKESILIGFMNIQSFPQKRTGKKNFNLSHTINDYGFSHLGLAETNVNWSQLNDEDRIPQRFRRHFDSRQAAFSGAHNKHDKTSGRRQARGTISITAGKM
eukprot:8098491-Ditylum_brightwellii.AAC.1